jgi:hypothetical protein
VIISADDMLIWEEVELSKWQSNLEETGLEINTEKSVVMRINLNQAICW